MFFHCASHRLNLVVNHLNSVSEIRNTISTVKVIINFFRESAVRRKYAPNIPAFCETRWSEKYKSIRIFKNHIEVLLESLVTLSNQGNSETRNKAFLLHCTATKPMFIVSVLIIAKYSALLEPVVNALQAKSLDLLKCADHIRTLTSIIKKHREDVDAELTDILADATILAQKLNIALEVPIVGQRSNLLASTFSQYCKRSIFIPYLDSLITLLQERFSDENSPAFALHSLHPKNMKKMSINDLNANLKQVSDFYELENLDNEFTIWHEIWKSKNLSNEELEQLEISDLVDEAETFLPTIKHALHISMAQPCTTCSIERSFSTLRRVKTWLRSSMGEGRLNGLCMLSVHRRLVKENERFDSEVIDKFANSNIRKLML